MSVSPHQITANHLEENPGHHCPTALVTPALAVEAKWGGVDLVDGIADEWRQLCHASPCDEPFFRPEWIAASVRAFANKQRVLLVTVRESGRLIAVLPLLDEKAKTCGLTIKKLRSAVKVQHSPRFDLVYGSRPPIEDVALSVWRYLKALPEWDIISFQNVPEGGALESLLNCARKDSFPTYGHMWAQSPYVVLDHYNSSGGISQFARSPKFRYKLRHAWRKLEKTGTLVLRRSENANTETLERFYRLEQSGWKGQKGTAIACSRETRHFYDALARFAEQFGYLSVYFLEHGGVIIAAHFGLTYAGKFYPLKIAYDETYSQYRPGHLIAGAVMEDCARRGIREFDWLGHWSPAKAEWTSDVRQQNFCYIFRDSLRGRALYWETRLQRTLQDKVTSAIQALLHRAV